MNSVQILGRPTKKIEIQYSQTNTEYVRFALASSIRVGEKEETTFLNCVAFKGYARVLSNVLKEKGRVLLTGTLKNNNYTNKDGVKVYEIYLLVNSVDVIDFNPKENKDDDFLEDVINPFKEEE